MSKTARPPATLAPSTLPEYEGAGREGSDGGFVVRPPPGADSGALGRCVFGGLGLDFVGDGLGSGSCGEGEPGPIVEDEPFAMGSDRGGSYSVPARTV